MWDLYGFDGVAVCSRYDLLKAALSGLLDEAHLGLVRYGTSHLKNTFNALEFITTKQEQYSPDREVRAILTMYDPLASGNRHFDLNNFPHPVPLDLNPRNSWVPDCKRRRIDLRALITEIIISPWAEPDVVEEITLWVKHKGFDPLTKKSELTGATTPTLEEFRKNRNIASNRIPEPITASETEASDKEIQQFDEMLSILTPSRVRFLYRQRWDVCRLYPGSIPRLADAQFLERTLRILDKWKRQGIDVY
jgi:hypothetical protein